jgi:hypothetical protein
MLAYRHSLGDDQSKGPAFVDLVYQSGLDYCEWAIESCNRQEQRSRRLLEAA